MLKPAQLYAHRLQEENVKAWYRPENMFWNGGAGDDDISLPDNNYEKHCFVSVNSDDDILGYICYIPDWDAMSVSDVCIISYQKQSVEFARDVYTAVCNIFEVYNMNRMQWHCYADNPAIRGYRKFIKRYGGKECGYRRQAVKLQDGRLHDMVEFEILRDEFHQKGNARQERECGKQISGDLISRSALERELKEMESESKAKYCENGRDDPFIEGGLSAIHSVFKIISKESIRVNGWIPCREKLPKCELGEETKALLFQMKETGVIEVGYFGRGGKYRDNYFRSYTDNMEGVDSSDVIAWQPLP